MLAFVAQVDLKPGVPADAGIADFPELQLRML